MKRLLKNRIPALLIVALLVFETFVLAATVFDLSWWSADGGGGTSSGGVYALSGTVGQPDAGAMTGGSYSLTGGFWSPTYYKNAALYWTLYE